MIKKMIYISAVLAGLSMPLSTKASNISLMLFCLFSIIYCYKNRVSSKVGLKILLFSTIGFFLLAIIGVFIAENIDTAYKHLGRRIFYVILPFSLCYHNRTQLKEILKYSLIGLVFGCVFSSFFLLTHTFQNYFQSRSFYQIGFDILNYHYTYHNFTAPLKIHPTYLGSYFFLSILALFHLIYQSKNRKIIAFIILSFLLLVSLFINSRIILGLIFIGLVCYFLRFSILLFQTNLRRFFLLIFFSLSFIFIGFNLVKNTYIYYRFTNELQWESSKQINTQINEKNGGDSRLARWEVILEAIKEKPFFGYGTGNEKEILHNKFTESNLYFSAKNQYDSHNLYLSYSIQFGFFGLVILLAIFMGNLIVSFQSKNTVYSLFIVGLILISMFENYLNNNAGIVFVSLFLNLFLFSNLRKDEYTT